MVVAGMSGKKNTFAFATIKDTTYMDALVATQITLVAVHLPAVIALISLLLWGRALCGGWSWLWPLILHGPALLIVLSWLQQLSVRCRWLYGLAMPWLCRLAVRCRWLYGLAMRMLCRLAVRCRWLYGLAMHWLCRLAVRCRWLYGLAMHWLCMLVVQFRAIPLHVGQARSIVDSIIFLAT